MNAIARTLMFAAFSAVTAAGLSLFFVLLAFRGEPPEGVAVVGIYSALSFGAVAAVMGAILYWTLFRFLTVDVIAKIVALTLAAELLVTLLWDAFGGADSRWFGGFLVIAWLAILLISEARRIARLESE